MTGAEEIALVELGLAAVKKIVDAISAARAGKVDSNAVMTSLASLHDELEAHNKKHQADLDAMFPTGGDT